MFCLFLAGNSGGETVSSVLSVVVSSVLSVVPDPAATVAPTVAAAARRKRDDAAASETPAVPATPAIPVAEGKDKSSASLKMLT